MSRKYVAGYTVVELLVTMALIGIIVSSAVAHLGALLRNSQQRALVQTYHEAFSYARWMAISHRQLVTVCPLSTGGSCVDDWTLPAAIFPDTDNDKRPDQDEVWRFVSPPSTHHIHSRTGGRGYLQFAASGMVYGASGGLVMCPSHNNKNGIMSYFALNRGGRFRSVRGKPGDREIRLYWGAKIRCPQTST